MNERTEESKERLTKPKSNVSKLPEWHIEMQSRSMGKSPKHKGRRLKSESKHEELHKTGGLKAEHFEEAERRRLKEVKSKEEGGKKTGYTGSEDSDTDKTKKQKKTKTQRERSRTKRGTDSDAFDTSNSSERRRGATYKNKREKTEDSKSATSTGRDKVEQHLGKSKQKKNKLKKTGISKSETYLRQKHKVTPDAKRKYDRKKTTINSESNTSIEEKTADEENIEKTKRKGEKQKGVGDIERGAFASGKNKKVEQVEKSTKKREGIKKIINYESETSASEKSADKELNKEKSERERMKKMEYSESGTSRKGKTGEDSGKYNRKPTKLKRAPSKTSLQRTTKYQEQTARERRKLNETNKKSEDSESETPVKGKINEGKLQKTKDRPETLKKVGSSKSGTLMKGVIEYRRHERDTKTRKKSRKSDGSESTSASSRGKSKSKERISNPKGKRESTNNTSGTETGESIGGKAKGKEEQDKSRNKRKPKRSEVSYSMPSMEGTRKGNILKHKRNKDKSSGSTESSSSFRRSRDRKVETPQKRKMKMNEESDSERKRKRKSILKNRTARESSTFTSFTSSRDRENLLKAFPTEEEMKATNEREGKKKKSKKRKSKARKKNLQQFYEVSSEKTGESSDERDEVKQPKPTLITEVVYTSILASLVPDEIIYHVDETRPRKYDVCLLFGDASGFTDLCERYSKAGKGGPSRLTVVLNSFIGTMVQEIMTHGGDVLKFSGDAFLAWWRTDDDLTDVQDCVAAAIETALIIQKSFGKYETDVQVTLRVKLAISAGQVAFSSIGTEDTKHYVVLGSPVWDVKIAEYLCVAGDIMVTPKAWALVNAQEYDHELMPDGQHVKVLGAGAGWRQMDQGYGASGSIGGGDGDSESRGGDPADDEWGADSRGLGSILFMTGEMDDHSDSELESYSSEDLGAMVGGEREEGNAQGQARPRKDETTSLRPSVTYAVKNKMRDQLRPYVIKPVLKGLDVDEPIEYLTEMRQVVIVFTNLVTLNPPMVKMIKIVDECYRIVCSSVHAHQGCVNKVSLFDKDMMFLVIFGLRGFKHELESQIALRCGAELHERLSTVDMVRVTSVGITTGMTYCGVVGHTLRREYSVIGPTVNKAARIMVAYPGKVTCDRDTFLHSRLESSNFILQEQKELKGLQQAGPIYEFREHLMPKKSHILSKFPLLSRDDEMGLFQVLCDEAKGRHYLHKMWNVKRKRSSLSAQKQLRLRGGTRHHTHSPKGKAAPGNKAAATAAKPREEEELLHHRSDSWYATHRFFIAGVVVRAEPRMGKSRLLDEMLHTARGHDVKVARIALTPKDYQMTLFGINRILEPVLNLPDGATNKEKEESLVSILKHVPHSKWKYLYTLNELFQTAIDFNRTYPSVRYPDPLKAMKRALWAILSATVKNYWVIGIDDLEFLDEASWTLLPVMLERDFAFFVMALGSRLDLARSSESILKNNKHLYHVSLGGIDKWFQAGLACQILDVWAIPPELERLIHERSGGNPGWVESYLVTQLQQKVLKVTSMTVDEADATGLVRPPARMITRAAARKAGASLDPTRMHPTEDRWEMFKACYHESKENVKKQDAGGAQGGAFKTLSEQASRDVMDLPLTQNMRLRLLQVAGTPETKTTRGEKMVAVCVLTPGAELLGQADDDYTVNSMMLKVFDSLTSYEQMLLKCASVLGESFLRKMLIALLSDPESRQLAQCVKKLFEMQVLSCATSDFGASHYASFAIASFSSRADYMLSNIATCQCQNLEIDEACRDLPPYASCNYMRFRMTAFRETIYSLLTDSQKKEYHERAMRYLEQETRRCGACGRRHFLMLLGTRYEHYGGRRYLRKRRHGERRRDRSSSRESLSWSESYTPSASTLTTGSGSPTRDDRSSAHSFMQQITYEDMLLSKIRQSWGDPDEPPSSGVIERSKAAHRYLPTGFPWTFVGFFQGKGRVPSAAGLSLTRSFSSFNFMHCECTLILTSVYTQILGHCRGAELDEKTMDALLEYAEVCVYISNHAQAQRLLYEARKLLAEAKTEPQFGIKKVEDTREGSYIPSWKWPYLMGRIHTLLGYSRLELGQYEEAHFQLHMAMAHMGVPFPENRFVLRVVTAVSRMRLALTTSFMARAWLGFRSGFAATYSDAIAGCLAYLYVVFRDMGDWASARLAATWGINKSLESGMDFLGVCISFANMLEVLQFYGEFVTCAKLEVGAMEVCRNRASYLEIQELVAVGRLYRIVFHSLMTRGRIESSISVGYKTLRIAAAVHASETRLDVLPGLICCLIARNRVSEAVTLLNDLEFIAEEDVDKTGLTWYFALSMEVHLSTGYSVLPYVRCEEFFKREGEAVYTRRNPQSSHRLYAALWLWCVRLEDWEGAKLWEHLARPEFTVPDLLSVRQYGVTITMIMQGLAIKLAHLMDVDDTKGAADTIQKIEKFCKMFTKACSYIRFCEPHYRAIKAYFIYLKSNNKSRQKKKALRELRAASEIATRQGNARMAEWCKHNEKMWRGLLAPVKAETWRDCAEPEALVDWHEADKTPPRIMHYTLPLPDCLD